MADLDFPSLRRRFEFLRVLAVVGVFVVTCGFVALAYYLTH